MWLSAALHQGGKPPTKSGQKDAKGDFASNQERPPLKYCASHYDGLLNCQIFLLLYTFEYHSQKLAAKKLTPLDCSVKNVLGVSRSAEDFIFVAEIRDTIINDVIF